MAIPVTLFLVVEKEDGKADKLQKSKYDIRQLETEIQSLTVVRGIRKTIRQGF